MINHHYSCNLCHSRIPDDGHNLLAGVSLHRNPINSKISLAHSAPNAQAHLCSWCFKQLTLLIKFLDEPTKTTKTTDQP